jgi:hypothetical protein
MYISEIDSVDKYEIDERKIFFIRLLWNFEKKNQSKVSANLTRLTWYSMIIDTAVAKIGDFIVEYLRECEAMYLTRVSVTLGKLFNKKKP